MSDTILSGRWTVHYLTENRRKALEYTGSGTRDSWDTIYLALMALFAQGTQMDDGIPIKADTPIDYLTGIFDAGDLNPWFIDPTSMEYAYGGGMKTQLWKRSLPGDGTGDIGIVRFPYTVGGGTDLDPGDIGKTVLSDDGDTGTLLHFTSDGSNGIAWVRPADNTLANDWNSTTTDFDVTGGVGTNCNQDSAATTGEMNWANIYNDTGGVASIVEDTHLAIYQGVKAGDTAPDALVLEYDLAPTNREDYWGDGLFDIMIMIADQSSNLATQSTYTDEGFATVLAKQYAKTYSYNIASLFPGGRKPIGMETGNDLNNNSGYRTMTLSGGSGNWTVGDEIVGATSLARGIITAIISPGATQEMEYYLIGKNTETGLIPFQNGETVDNDDDTGQGTLNVGPANDGPALLSGLSVVHANTSADVNQDGTLEYYSITFDVSDETLADGFEWSKYEYRRGNTATTHSDGIEAEQYIGSDYRVVYTGTVTGTVAEGDVVTGVTSGAKATVVAHHTGQKIAILRNTRGNFQDAEQIQVDGGNYIPASGTTVAAIQPIKANPLGIFAGGKFFFAPGVVVTNRLSADANNYECVDDLGNTEIKEPVQISIVIGNTRVKDWIAVYRMTGSGGEIDKNRYTVTAGGLTKGDNTVVVNEANIEPDEPGKSAGGILILRDVGTFAEHIYHFSSWASQTFTLDQSNPGPQGTIGGDTDTLTDDGAAFTTERKVGELIRDVTNDEWAYVLEIVSDTEMTMTPKASAWSTCVSYVPNDLVQNYDSADKIYTAAIYLYETEGTDVSPGSASVTFIYDSNFYALLRARHAADSSYNIKSFSLELFIENANKSQDVIRTPETITS